MMMTASPISHHVGYVDLFENSSALSVGCLAARKIVVMVLLFLVVHGLAKRNV